MPELNLGKVVGPQGPQGAAGPAGAEGKQGPPGATGEAGKSAYQAAKDGGYTGTEAEFNAIMAIIDKHAGRHKTGGADPITPAQIGAVDKIVTLASSHDLNNIAISGFYRLAGVTTNVPPGCSWGVLTVTGDENTVMQNISSQIGKTYIRALDSGSVWSEWKQLATTDYAVNKAGDEITGKMTFKNICAVQRQFSDGKAWVDLNPANYKQAGKYVASMRLTLDDAETAMLAFNDAGIILRNMATGATYGVLHTGNKPRNHYNGDGNATAETLCTGAVGNMAIICGNGKFTIVTENGGVCSDGTTLTAEQVKFVGGILTVSTSDERVNKLSNPVTKYFWLVP